MVSKGRFLSFGNITDMLASAAALGVMAIGLLVVIISGGIDISFMATATVAQYLAAMFIMNIGGNMFVVFGVAIMVGIVLGLINAALVYNLKVPAIIITIATMNVFYGFLMYFTGGTWLYGFPEWFATKTSVTVLVIPIGILVFASLLTWWILKYSNIGRHVYAVGDNAEASKRVGIKVYRTLLFAYAYMGVMAALGSVVLMYVTQNVAPNALIGKEMEVLAMVVLGGAALSGGKGTVIGTLFGLMLVTVINNGLVFVGVSSYYQTLFMGVVVMMSFCFTGLRGRKKRGKEIEQ
ncbi:ABC transporter permease [Vallitalea sediminicola]